MSQLVYYPFMDCIKLLGELQPESVYFYDIRGKLNMFGLFSPAMEIGGLKPFIDNLKSWFIKIFLALLWFPFTILFFTYHKL